MLSLWRVYAAMTCTFSLDRRLVKRLSPVSVSIIEKFPQLWYIFSDESDEDSAPKLCGVPSFIIQEEFDRFTGYWWRPVAGE